MKTKVNFGNCQCCGQEVKLTADGKTERHGTISMSGAVSAQCSGQGELPMQSDRALSKRFVANISRGVEAAKKQLSDYRSGKSHPDEVLVMAKPGKLQTLRWEDATQEQRETYLAGEVERIEASISVERHLGLSLLELAALVHNDKAA